MKMKAFALLLGLVCLLGVVGAAPGESGEKHQALSQRRPWQRPARARPRAQHGHDSGQAAKPPEGEA